MHRVLVTGAAGFIGSNLCRELQVRGYDVIALDNYSCGVRENLEGFGGQILKGDTTQAIRLEGAVHAVFHHGDITDPRHPSDEEVYRKNLASFRNVLDLALGKGARLIYASTAGLYGNGATPMKEDQDKQLLTSYGRSKLEMDRVAAEHYGRLPIVGLRYFNVFGPRETHKGRAASMIYHLGCMMSDGRRPRLFNFGEQRRDFIYVKDVVEAILHGLDAKSGVYNVGTGVASTFNEVVEAINLALGTQLEVEYFAMPFDLATYQDNTQADTTLAEQHLGFSAKWSLKEGVADYMKWLGFS